MIQNGIKFLVVGVTCLFLISASAQAEPRLSALYREVEEAREEFLEFPGGTFRALDGKSRDIRRERYVRALDRLHEAALRIGDKKERKAGFALIRKELVQARLLISSARNSVSKGRFPHREKYGLLDDGLLQNQIVKLGPDPALVAATNAVAELKRYELPFHSGLFTSSGDGYGVKTDKEVNKIIAELHHRMAVSKERVLKARKSELYPLLLEEHNRAVADYASISLVRSSGMNRRIQIGGEEYLIGSGARKGSEENVSAPICASFGANASMVENVAKVGTSSGLTPAEMKELEEARQVLEKKCKGSSSQVNSRSTAKSLTGEGSGIGESRSSSLPLGKFMGGFQGR